MISTTSIANFTISKNDKESPLFISPQRIKQQCKFSHLGVDDVYDHIVVSDIKEKISQYDACLLAQHTTRLVFEGCVFAKNIMWDFLFESLCKVQTIMFINCSHEQDYEQDQHKSFAHSLLFGSPFSQCASKKNTPLSTLVIDSGSFEFFTCTPQTITHVELTNVDLSHVCAFSAQTVHLTNCTNVPTTPIHNIYTSLEITILDNNNILDITTPHKINAHHTKSVKLKATSSVCGTIHIGGSCIEHLTIIGQPTNVMVENVYNAKIVYVHNTEKKKPTSVSFHNTSLCELHCSGAIVLPSLISTCIQKLVLINAHVGLTSCISNLPELADLIIIDVPYIHEIANLPKLTKFVLSSQTTTIVRTLKRVKTPIVITYDCASCKILESDNETLRTFITCPYDVLLESISVICPF